MKKRIVKILALACAVVLLPGCGSNNAPQIDTEYTEPEEVTTDADIPKTPVKNSTATSVESVPEIELTGDYDSIFDREIKTESYEGEPHIIISGHDFTVDDNTFVTYFEDIGPTFAIGNSIQYRIKVQDKTFDEVKSSDVTAKAVAAGFEITAGPENVKDGDLEYISFAYIADGERGAAINMAGPDKDHALGVQIAILDSSVSDKDAMNAALAVAKTAKLTNAADTTEEEIGKMYNMSSFVSGASLSDCTIKFNGTKYNHPIPSGFKQIYEDTDEDGYMADYKKGDLDVFLTYSENKHFTDADHYNKSLSEWRPGKVTESGTINDVAFLTMYDKEFKVHELLATKIVNENYIFHIDVENENGDISFEDINGFFMEVIEEKPEDASTAIGPRTAIKHDQIYKGSVTSEADALKLAAQYGQMQRERYDDSTVSDIEKRLQDKYQIAAVNLGEIDIETAKDIERGVSYMFDTYPILKGSLHTISLGNLKGRDSTLIAITKTVDFVLENEDGMPKVVRNEIILNAGKWLNRDYMMDLCKDNVETGYWFKGANDPSKVIVHELGHQLLNVIRAKKFGFVSTADSSVYMPSLITEQIRDQYLEYYWAGTALNQDVEKELMANAYSAWKAAGNSGSEEDFRASISQYAKGIKSDGGVSYHETFAEAVADIYCNGDNASDASKLILEQIK